MQLARRIGRGWPKALEDWSAFSRARSAWARNAWTQPGVPNRAVPSRRPGGVGYVALPSEREPAVVAAAFFDGGTWWRHTVRLLHGGYGVPTRLNMGHGFLGDRGWDEAIQSIVSAHADVPWQG